MSQIGSNEKITTQQAAVFVANYILGVGILTLPRAAAEKVKTPDIWLTVILGGLIAMVAGIIVAKLSQQYPGKTIYEYSQHIVGKWLGIVLNASIIIYFIVTSGNMVRAMSEVMNLYLLEGTPRWVVIMSFLWVGMYIIVGGVSAIARFFEIVFPLTVLTILFLALLSFKIFDVNNLRPVLGQGIGPVLNGVKTTGLSFSGFEILLVLQAYMSTPKKAVRAVVIGILIPILFYVVTVVMVVGALSISGVVSQTWPTITLFRSFEYPGILFERYESLLLVIWVIQIFTTYAITHYAAALGIARMVNKDIRPMLYALIPVIYLASMSPRNINDLFSMGERIGDVAMIMFGILPAILLIIVKWRRRLARNEQEQWK
ncbi:GerAB/ArcD/ProY family transporter [Paenibacillus alvei]|uniref:GerAB/ArcD/ProY family transporter n=1 Tax=Paenibacillus alvei TaxID=44250 RepID=A0AAP7A1K2_PAEAL|nr:spore germination protein [Paenibacillus alvei]MCY9581766.1 spore germination protein [Paenibacillus alvei]MCY9586898.1 spore germination protein [Paenibacillus alvei]NOJ71192.1 GerAB/ArcD/ProY family transporter [Paenibacillus alvei]